MKDLLRVAHKPVVTITNTATVIEAVRAMFAAHVGAAAVVENGRLQGIFTERDVMARVVLEGRDPKTTRVRDVMTARVATIAADTSPKQAVGIMLEHHFRHLPVVDAKGSVVGMLSMRHIMREHVDRLEQSVGALASYISADGIGG
jgi:CBS domain-containing protein